MLPILRERVRFARNDLRQLKPLGSGFSLVVCKNVLLHLGAAERVSVLRMFSESLAPGGLLLTETTQKMPAECAPLFARICADAELHERIAPVA